MSTKKTNARPARRQGPGRPGGISQGRDQILDAAEAAFAEFGYVGTSMREIANRANVTTALATYYFGTKEKLFEEIFLRRGLPIVEERMAELSELKERKGRSIEVRDLVKTYLAPILRLPRTAESRNFLRIHARLHMEPEEFGLRLRRKVYNESTKAYAEAFHEALPHLPLKTLYWRLILLVGSTLYVISGTHRIAELSGGACNPHNVDEFGEHIADFVCAGMLAPIGLVGDVAEKSRKRPLHQMAIRR
ncbi:MAG TPA: TetR family transcriptional regulator [Alphaproteobacteria bacterium]|nr:TetR family transcriptional regulator [Alphaproteobacteria bacterium]